MFVAYFFDATGNRNEGSHGFTKVADSDDRQAQQKGEAVRFYATEAEAKTALADHARRDWGREFCYQRDQTATNHRLAGVGFPDENIPLCPMHTEQVDAERGERCYNIAAHRHEKVAAECATCRCCRHCCQCRKCEGCGEMFDVTNIQPETDKCLDCSRVS